MKVITFCFGVVVLSFAVLVGLVGLTVTGTIPPIFDVDGCAFCGQEPKDKTSLLVGERVVSACLTCKKEFDKRKGPTRAQFLSAMTPAQLSEYYENSRYRPTVIHDVYYDYGRKGWYHKTSLSFGNNPFPPPQETYDRKVFYTK